MAIVDHTLFTDDILLVSDKPSQQDDINAKADKFEPQYLKVLMGSEMYYDFMDNINSAPYDVLINGDDEVFEWDGQHWKFEGIKRMLACFIYYHIVFRLPRQMTKRGVFVEKAETGDTVKPTLEALEAWTEGVKLFIVARNYILYKSSLFPKFCGKQLSFKPAL